MPAGIETGDDAETDDDTEADPVGQLFDLVSYAVALLLHFVVVSAVLAAVLGTPVASGVKYGLFVLGWLAFGYASYLLFPTSAWDDDNGHDSFGVPPQEESGFQSLAQRPSPVRFRQTPSDDDDSGYDPFGVPPDEETRFQSFAQRLPPARFHQIQPSHRLPTGVRLFVASLVVLGTSLVLGQVFGIGP